MSVINANPLMLGDAGYNIGRSLRFRSSASAYLNRTPASASNRQTWTWSGWVKRGALGTTTGMAYQQLFGACPASGSDATFTELVLNGNDTLQIGGWTTTWKVTTQVFRDTSAWYHFVWVLDTGNATAADRMRLYVNGSRITSFSTSNDPSLNATLGVNNNVAHALGSEQPYSSRYFDGYLAEVNFIDGQALTPSSFGQTDAVTGVWTPKKYTGTYGTNGFYLPFSDNTSATTLAYDKSGNGNNWTPNNISTTAGATYDSMTDVPTLTSATAANFAVLNPIGMSSTGGTLSGGNLNLQTTTGTPHVIAAATMAIKTKSYCEFTIASSLGSAVGPMVIDLDQAMSSSNAVFYIASGTVYNPAALTGYPSFTNGDTIGIAYDPATKNVWFAKNGTWISGDPVAGTGGFTNSVFGSNVTFAFDDETSSYAATVYANFGQRPFSYTPPTGFKALNTFNLPDPTIKKPNQYMDATTYTGTGGSQTVANAAGFAPDLVWLKMRNLVGENYVWDSVRGGGSALDLVTNLANAEGFNSAYHNLAFASNGFTVTQIAPGNEVNYSGNSYIGWQWKKGATPGFDIVTFTSPASGNFTVNHSLGVTPAMVIVKTRDTAGWNWHVWHKSLASATNSVLLLNSTAAVNSSFNMWGAAGATSTTIGITTGNPVPANSACVAYLFAEIAGFSKFGSYTGNGSADGPFVYCGFRPKYVMIKGTNVAEHWMIFDSARNTYNYVDRNLFANLSNAEESGTPYVDFVSNGFKLRANQTRTNGSYNYIFAAFAENPFKYSNAR